MKKFIATAAICMLPFSANAVEFTNANAKLLYDKAMEGNNTTINLLYAYVLQGNSDQAMIEAAKSVSQTVDDDDIPEAPDVVMAEATHSSAKSTIGYESIDTGHSFEATYEKLDFEIGEIPEEIQNWKGFNNGHYAFNYDNFQIIGKIKLNKERKRKNILNDITHNYGDTLYIYEYDSPWSDKKQWGNIHHYSRNLGGDPCYAYCENGMLYNLNGNMNHYDVKKENLATEATKYAVGTSRWNKDSSHVIVHRGDREIVNIELTDTFVNKTQLPAVQDLVERVAEAAYETGYTDGYSDGYADGYRDGFADGVASVQAELQ